MPAGLYVTFAAIVASVGGVLFGYDIGITSGALLQLRKDFSLTSFEQEMVVSAVLIGAFCASFFGGSIVDGWGRKAGIGVSSFLFIVGAIILCLSVNVAMLIVGRLVVGTAVSLSVTSECTYISEISPPSHRGMMVSLNEVGITVGFLLAYLINYLFITVVNGWKYMFGAAAVLALIQAFGVALMPNSHHFLLIKGRTDQARKVLRNLRNQNDVEEEMETIITSIEEQKNRRYVDLFSVSSNMRSRMFLGMALVVLQQFSGHANVLYYAPTVFQHFGYDSDSLATLVTVGLGVVKVMSTTFTLLIVDKVGRRSLLLTGCLLMAISIMTLGVVGTLTDVDHANTEHATVSVHHHPIFIQNFTNKESISYKEHETDGLEKQEVKMDTSFKFTPKTNELNLSVVEKNTTYDVAGKTNICNVSLVMKVTSLVSLMVFVCAYGVSYGPVTWLILSEIFPGSLRGRAISVATCLNWGSNIIVSLTFLDILKSVGIGPTFMMYGFICFGAAVFVFLCVPETKSKTLEQINELLKKGLLQNTGTCGCSKHQNTYSVQKPNDAMDIN